MPKTQYSTCSDLLDILNDVNSINEDAKKLVERLDNLSTKINNIIKQDNTNKCVHEHDASDIKTSLRDAK